MNNYDMFWKNGFLHVPDVFNSEEIDNYKILYLN